ncbi:MAG TPA: beta-xylosidase [Chitinophagaceae bacterium]|jgi:xylan 1,4-beta-xylosidase|nr:beta-xylosidase [Chitinophagaceae bacterium]
MKLFQKIFCIATAILCLQTLYVSAQTDVYNIKIDLTQKKGSFKPIWAFFGYDEPNYTYMKDGRKLLTELAELSPVPVYVRCHNMLTSGNGTPHLKWGSTNAYTEDANGNSVYDWRITDSIFDTYIKRGMKPIAEIGFMPEALSINPQPYEHHWAPDVAYNKIYTGWAYPPKDYKKWGELVYQWVKHCVEKYGNNEVETWWWEVWNEPDIGYWQGTKEEYFKLYDFAADAVKRACAKTRIGGPTTTSSRNEKAYSFLVDFLKHCDEGINYATGQKGSPLDYVSFHAKGTPRLVNGIVRMNMAVQLTDIYRGFEAVVSSPKFKNLPIIIGECDPEGCAACSVMYNPQNAYRNGTVYSSYTAASYSRIYDIADKLGVNIEGAVSWSFEFEDQPWFAGFRDLATNGIDKPVLNVFRMFGMMRGERLQIMNNRAFTLEQLQTNGVHDSIADVHALATADKRSAYIMVWNYYDDDIPALDAELNLQINSIPSKKIKIEEYSIDEVNSNSYSLWKKMGSPQNVYPQQYGELEKTGKLKLISEQKMNIKLGSFSKTIQLPRQAVKLIKISW